MDWWLGSSRNLKAVGGGSSPSRPGTIQYIWDHISSQSSFGKPENLKIMPQIEAQSVLFTKRPSLSAAIVARHFLSCLDQLTPFIFDFCAAVHQSCHRWIVSFDKMRETELIQLFRLDLRINNKYGVSRQVLALDFSSAFFADLCSARALLYIHQEFRDVCACQPNTWHIRLLLVMWIGRWESHCVYAYCKFVPQIVGTIYHQPISLSPLSLIHFVT